MTKTERLVLDYMRAEMEAREDEPPQWIMRNSLRVFAAPWYVNLAMYAWLFWFGGRRWNDPSLTEEDY